MEKYLLDLLENGGVVGAFVVGATLLIGLFLRSKGLLFLGGDQRVSADELHKLTGRVSAIDQRISQVERDIQHLPTREEMHGLELEMTRMQGRMDGLERTTTATNHAVIRIEDFMYEVSKRAKK